MKEDRFIAVMASVSNKLWKDKRNNEGQRYSLQMAKDWISLYREVVEELEELVEIYEMENKKC